MFNPPTFINYLYYFINYFLLVSYNSYRSVKNVTSLFFIIIKIHIIIWMVLINEDDLNLFFVFFWFYNHSNFVYKVDFKINPSK